MTTYVLAAKKVYLRFGLPPPDFKSRDYYRDEVLEGTSVYHAEEKPNGAITMETLRLADGTYDSIVEDFLYKDLKAYLVTGDELDEEGPDGEPLLQNVEVIRELKEGEFNDDLNRLGERWWYRELEKLQEKEDEDGIKKHIELKTSFPGVNWVFTP